MSLRILLLAIFLGHCALSVAQTAEKKKILVVSSYNKEYLWSQSTQKGLVASLLKYRYLDSAQQGDTFTNSDFVESSKAVLRKEWMDTKRANSKTAIAAQTHRILEIIDEFKPDLVMLGDDNATNYIGNQLLDTATPVVFWGVNGLPIKYGLVDNMDRPGHNITGVWQQGYPKESLEFLKKLVPTAKTFAIIACDSETSRPVAKQIAAMARDGHLPLKLVTTVTTNSFEDFKRQTLELSRKVDAFFVLNHDTMTDNKGRHVDMLVVGEWYLKNIKKPEASPEDQFVREGMLLTANDSGYNQSFLAFEMAYDILEQGLNPGRMRPKTPARGPLMVNMKRANMLGIRVETEMYEAIQPVTTAAALDK